MSPDDRDDNSYDFGDLIDKARDDKAEQDMLADEDRSRSTHNCDVDPCPCRFFDRDHTHAEHVRAVTSWHSKGSRWPIRLNEEGSS